MKKELTYSNGKILDFLNWASNNYFIVLVVCLFIAGGYFFLGVRITADSYEQGTINFAKTVCGGGKIDSIRQWSSQFGGDYGAVPVSYSIVCTEKEYGIHEIYYFYLVPSWAVEDEKGNLNFGETVMWGGVFGDRNYGSLFGVIQ